jgi:hypothetical protein
LYRDRLEANEAWGYQPWPLFPQPNGVPTVHSPWGVKSCDPSAPSAQQYFDSVGLCVFDFLADVAIGVDLLVVQLRTVRARAAGTEGATDEPTTARLTARNVLPFASLFLAAVLILDILSIAVAGVRSGGDAVSDAAPRSRLLPPPMPTACVDGNGDRTRRCVGAQTASTSPRVPMPESVPP